MNEPRSMLLKDSILATLAEGSCVTAETVARRWGADRVLVLEYLDRFRSDGLCRSWKIGPRQQGRSKRLPFDVFAPNLSKIHEHLNRSPKSP